MHNFKYSCSAYASAMRYNSLTCILDYYDADVCTTPSEYLVSTDLSSSVSNFGESCP